MFFFKKKSNKPEYFSSPLNGELIPLKEVSDETFANGLIGVGFGIKPSTNILHMPFDGEIVMVFPTKHAIGLKDLKGSEYLVHIGVDTVNMNGEGFKSYVSAGEKVKKGAKLIKFPLNRILELGLDSVVMVVKTTQPNEDFELKEHKMIKIQDDLIEL